MTQNIRHGQEVVLLMDENTFRPCLVKTATFVGTILERVHLSADHTQDRLWLWQGERALTGQRIFREPPTPVAPEPSEKPLFDELVIKTPLPFWTPPQS